MLKPEGQWSGRSLRKASKRAWGLGSLLSDTPQAKRARFHHRGMHGRALQRRLGAALTLSVLWAAGASTAWAGVQSEFEYDFDKVWNSAIRVLRVDYRAPIRDRDKDAGYVLFDYDDRGRKVDGSVEMVRTESHGEPIVKVRVSIPSMPSYIEQMMVDRLQRKLRTDFGPPTGRTSRPSTDSSDARSDDDTDRPEDSD
ncbi:MAG: hypothetical protein AAF550_09295 [Myxococcota bacterium]